MPTNQYHKENQIPEKILRFTHTNRIKMKALFNSSGYLTPEIPIAFFNAHSSCEICVSSGHLVIRKKHSLKHGNYACNNKIQADFVTVYIIEKTFQVPNIVDIKTEKGERII